MVGVQATSPTQNTGNCHSAFSLIFSLLNKKTLLKFRHLDCFVFLHFSQISGTKKGKCIQSNICDPFYPVYAANTPAVLFGERSLASATNHHFPGQTYHSHPHPQGSATFFFHYVLCGLLFSLSIF